MIFNVEPMNRRSSEIRTDMNFCLCMINKFASLGSACFTRPYRNVHFIYAGYTMCSIENPP